MKAALLNGELIRHTVSMESGVTLNGRGTESSFVDTWAVSVSDEVDHCGRFGGRFMSEAFFANPTGNYRLIMATAAEFAAGVRSTRR